MGKEREKRFVPSLDPPFFSRLFGTSTKQVRQKKKGGDEDFLRSQSSFFPSRISWQLCCPHAKERKAFLLLFFAPLSWNREPTSVRFVCQQVRRRRRRRRSYLFFGVRRHNPSRLSAGEERTSERSFLIKIAPSSSSSSSSSAKNRPLKGERDLQREEEEEGGDFGSG